MDIAKEINALSKLHVNFVFDAMVVVYLICILGLVWTLWNHVKTCLHINKTQEKWIQPPLNPHTMMK